MNIRIKNLCRSRLPFNIEGAVRDLLGNVPQEHLIGLDAIIIVDRVTHKKSRQASAIYWPKEGQQPPTIEIAANPIYGGMPWIFFFLPFIARFILADVLFHEIGHHYQRLTHGVTKNARENFAEIYKRKMLREVFFWWRLLLLPLAPLARWLNRIAMNRPHRRGTSFEEQE